MTDEGIGKGAKAPFEPPRLIAIELATAEVLGTACKLNTQSPTGPSGAYCAVTSCLYNGS